MTNIVDFMTNKIRYDKFNKKGKNMLEINFEFRKGICFMR